MMRHKGSLSISNVTGHNQQIYTQQPRLSFLSRLSLAGILRRKPVRTIEGKVLPGTDLVGKCYCGDLSWTVKYYGRLTHKHGCPQREEPYCQSHPTGCGYRTTKGEATK